MNATFFSFILLIGSLIGSLTAVGLLMQMMYLRRHKSAVLFSVLVVLCEFITIWILLFKKFNLLS